MTDREKLIELLLVEFKVQGFLPPYGTICSIAEDLIANGVTVLPCKVGDMVYFPVEDYHDSAVIDGINITELGISFTWVQYEVGADITECWDDGEFDADEIGKTVFLTREEAEAHLSQLPKGE